MKKLDKKNLIKMGVSFWLIALTLVSIYGVGGAFKPDQSLLIALARLPENQKWEIKGSITLEADQFDMPIDVEYASDIYYSKSSNILTSQWRLDSDWLGEESILNLAYEKGDWLVEIPLISKEKLWEISSSNSKISQNDLIKWIKELNFDKKGYKTLSRKYGGNVSCLHLQSQSDLLVNKLITWLDKLSAENLSEKRKKKLQKSLKEGLSSEVNCYLTPELKIMEIEVLLILSGDLKVKFLLNARPEKSVEPDLSYFQNKEREEVNQEMLEKLLDNIEKFE